MFKPISLTSAVVALIAIISAPSISMDRTQDSNKKSISVNQQDKGKKAESLLFASAKKGDVATIQRLLKQGVNVDARDEKQRTALLLATWEDHPKVAKVLIDNGGDVNAQDQQQDSPFLVAGAQGRIDILKMTLAHGADLKSTNRYGGNALIPASEKGYPEAVRLLISAGIDVNHINDLGWSSLLEVAILGKDTTIYQDIAKQLIAAGANINVKDKEGMTVLQHAKRRELNHIVILLEKAGAK